MSLLTVILIGCTTGKISPADSNFFANVNNKAADLMMKSKRAEAQLLLLDAVSKCKPKPSPFVERGALYFYGVNPTQSLAAMLESAAFGTVKNKDSVRNNPGHYKRMFDLEKDGKWDNSYVIKPDYPFSYFLIANNYVEEKQFDKAVAYLDTALYIWNGYSVAWSELIYTYSAMGNFAKGKEIGVKALEIDAVKFDKPGTSAILRKLGWIAVEENDWKKAEDYYKQSFNLDSNEIAKKELEYIKRNRTD